MRTILLAMLVLLVAMFPLTTGCGPSTPSIQAVVQQAVQAQTASILSQVDWKQVMTALEGKVGPETVIEAEAYMKQAAGMTIRIHGGELQFRTQASGTGGRDNSSELERVIVPILQRYEHQDNLDQEARRQLTAEVTSALIRHFEAKAQSGGGSTVPPASVPAQPAVTEPKVQPTQ